MADGDPAQQGNQNAGSADGQSQAGSPQPLTISAEVLGAFKDDPVFKPLMGKPVEEMVKGYVNAQKLVGADKVIIPTGKLDTDENWGAVYDRLGRPKDVNGYKFERPQLPAGLAYNEDLEKTFREVCHKAGLNQKQAQPFYELWNKMALDSYNANEGAQARLAEETEAALMKDLGNKEKVDKFLAGAKSMLKQFGGTDADVQAFIDKFGNDPIVIRTLGNAARSMSEAAALRGDKQFDMSASDVDKAIQAIQFDEANTLHKAYWNKNHPQHQFAVDEMARLMEIKHGQEAAKI